jgi:hypothetical protein
MSRSNEPVCVGCPFHLKCLHFEGHDTRSLWSGHMADQLAKNVAFLAENGFRSSLNSSSG